MRDPFVILRAELVSAADRAALPAPRNRWGWLRRPSRPVAVLLVALVIAGCAAAVASLTGSASKPLAGRVPGAITPTSLAGYSYTIAVTPSLPAGVAGWESLIIYARTNTNNYNQTGGTLGYPSATYPAFGGGTGPDSCPFCFARGNAVTYVLTGPQVFAVRIGSRTIRTVASPALPTGDRAAVVFIPAKGRVFLFPAQGSVPVLKHPPGMKSVLVVGVVPLARSGQVIPTHFTPYPVGPPPLTWMAPDALSRWWPLGEFTVPYQGPGYHAPTRPRPGSVSWRNTASPRFTSSSATPSPGSHRSTTRSAKCSCRASMLSTGWTGGRSRPPCCSMATGRGRFWGQFPARGRYPASRTWSTSPSGESP